MGLFDFLRGSGGVEPPPPSLDHRLDRSNPPVPLTYVFTERREPHAGISYITAPDSQFYEVLDLPIGWQEAPDPIRQSDFWADGNKVHPQAHMPIPSNLAIGAKEAVMEDTFHIGKLLGYIHRPMYAGEQLPSPIRANIQEAVPTTYGSQYEVQGVQPAGQVTTATGISQYPLPSVDGDPYWG